MFSTLPHIRATVDQDGAVILDIQCDAMVTLNSTGGYIWNKLAEGRTTDEIIRELANDTGEDSLSIEKDVRQFLEQLAENHLMTRC